jgi:hypothetical protein
MFSVRSAVGSKHRDFVRVVYTGYLEMIFYVLKSKIVLKI